MGTNYGIRCKYCQYKKDFIVGIGFLYSPYNLMDINSKSALLRKLIKSKEDFAKVKTLIQINKAELADDYGHKVYHCPQCGEFYERFFIHLEYDGASFEVEYKCPLCKISLNLLGDNNNDSFNHRGQKIKLNKYPCPQCGKYGLFESRDEVIMWD